MEITHNNLPEAVAEIASEVNEIKKLLLEKSDEQKSEPDQLLTIQQASELLNLSVPTLYGYVQRSGIPVCKRGKRLYFSRSELLDWIKAGRKKTLSEISAEAENYLSNKKGR